MIAANEVPEREIARLAGLLAHEAGADFAIKVLGNIQRALEPMALARRVSRRLSASGDMAAIVRRVAEAHGVTVEEIMGQSRRRDIAWPRQEAYAACYAMGKGDQGPYSLPAIGRFFSRDHSTVLHGIKEHRRRSPGSFETCDTDSSLEDQR